MRWMLCGFVAGAAALLAIAGPARAEDKAYEPKYKFHDTKEHKERQVDLRKPDEAAALVESLKKGEVEHLELDKGMPDPMALSAELGVWSLVIFVALVFILRKMAWGPMLEGLQKREEQIKGAVEEAKLARAETQRISAEFKAKMDQAYAEIPRMMEEARRDAEALKEELRTQANKEIQTERSRLRREIDTARDQALQELWTQAAQLATLISAKVIGKSLTEEDHRRLFTMAVDELKESTDRYRSDVLKS